MSKGKRRERQAAELYERAGYATYRPQHSKWGETDMFNLFDILAIPRRDVDNPTKHAGEPVRLVQVKSNRAEGVEQWCRDVVLTFTGRVKGDFLVCHDREGWRLLAPHATSPWKAVENPDIIEPKVWVDERDEDGAMGDSIVEYLGGDTDG